ncbi:MAG: sigma-70 family RNA polymerase sigma factor [Planctomycetales bacterium]|nr:sigma-70 family RNA polymerase sigma factor [Planctomycetales bacterium]
MPNENNSDAEMSELLQLARSSDEALGQLLTRYSTYLHGLAGQLLDERIRHRVSHTDVVQDTFANAIKSFGLFRGQTAGEFVAWLRRILKNCVAKQAERHLLTAQRDARREVSLQVYVSAHKDFVLMLDDVRTNADSEFIDQREQSVRLMDEIEMLPADQRDCIKMRHLDGLRFREIAQRLNCSEAAARMRYARGIAKLRGLTFKSHSQKF